MVQILNLWASKWLGTIWTVSWQSGILVVVVFFVTKMLRNRLTPTVRHILWTLVVAKLLITPFVSVPITVRVKTPALPAAAPTVVLVAPETVPLYAPPEQHAAPLHPSSFLFLFWLFGITTIFLLITTRSAKLCRQVRSAEALEDKEIMAAVARGTKQLNLKPPKLKVSGEFTGPLVCGIINPVLVIPRQILAKFKPGELEPIILHELAHLKRRDVLTNWLQALVQALYFFNPLVWYVNRQIRLEREQACDDWAVQVNKGERKEYAAALLKVVELCPKPTGLALNVVGISEPFTSMRRRLEMVMDTGRRISTKVSLKALLVLLVVGLIVMPAYGVTKKLVVGKTLVAAATPVTEAVDIKPTIREPFLSKFLVLKGVFVESEGKVPSLAFIENLQTNSEAIYREGDEIAGARISRIENGKVVFVDKEGKEIVITPNPKPGAVAVATENLAGPDVAENASQNPGFTLTGIVKDEATGRPIAGAIVSDDGYGSKPYKQAATDSAGKYSYATWGEEHNVVAQAPNYRPQRKTLTADLIQLKKEGILNFELARERSLVEMKFGENTSTDTVKKTSTKTASMVVENGKPAEITIGDLKIENNVTKIMGAQCFLQMKLSRKDKEGGFKIIATPRIMTIPGREAHIESRDDDGTLIYSISVKVTDVK